MRELATEIEILSEQTLLTPEKLLAKLPSPATVAQFVHESRQTIQNILAGRDKRLLVIVGPCSIHDTHAALEYAEKLSTAASNYSDKLFIVMRAYFEKPRTTIGWKGFISDPYLDKSFDANAGLKHARQLLIHLAELKVPAATEFLNSLIPPYLSDLISWTAIGARTSESQLHRELASSLPYPVGFKNTTDGNIQVAIDAVQVAGLPHDFLTINHQGLPMVLHTRGNANCHIVLRGSNHSPNYSSAHLDEAIRLLKESNLPPRLIIDCSHGNSMKNPSLQEHAIDNVIEQLRKNKHDIFGVMLESHLVPGKQTLTDKQLLVYGQSITDGCIGWDDTVKIFEKLALS